MIPGGPQLIVPRDYERPMVPSAIADAVAQWARNWGRSVRWQWVDYPNLSCWAVHLSPLPDSPVLEGVRKQRIRPEGAEEHLLLIDAGQAMDLEQYGPSGVVSWLEQHNMFSGRGAARSLEEHVNRMEERHREIRRRARAGQQDTALERAKERRRKIFRIPFVSVGLDLKGKS